MLPWEDEGEYRALLDALVAEHAPQGPTEEHFVEELAGILWRKRRLRLAEAAAYHRGLEGTLRPYRETVKAALVHLDATQQFEKVVDAIRATPAETEEDLADLEEDEAMTRRALDLLGAGKADAYDAAAPHDARPTSSSSRRIASPGPLGSSGRSKAPHGSGSPCRWTQPAGRVLRPPTLSPAAPSIVAAPSPGRSLAGSCPSGPSASPRHHARLWPRCGEVALRASLKIPNGGPTGMPCRAV